MTATEHIAGYARMSLDETLGALCAFGSPSLRKMRAGWFCTLTLTSGKHSGTECKSQFNHVSPLSAAHEAAAAVSRLTHNA